MVVSTMGHVGVFGVLAVLFWWALGLGRWTGTRRAALAVVLTVMYGVTDEWHQSLVPGRTPDPMDVLTDAVGAIVAMLVVRWLERREAFIAWEREGEMPSLSR